MRRLLYAAALVVCSAGGSSAQAPATERGSVRVTVIDAQQGAVPGATCSLLLPGYAASVIAAVISDANGIALVENVQADAYTLRVEIPGFETLVKTNLFVRRSETTDVRVILEVAALSERVSISAPANPASSTDVAAGASTPVAALQRQALQRLPLTTARIDAAFAVIPGVVRSSRGEISMKGGTEQQSALLVNGMNATDPASGGFRLSLPIDSVEGVQVFLHPYTAEYGQFTGGVTRVETRAGGDRWHFELNDFMPDPRIVNGKVIGIAEDTPHLNLNGPIVAHRVFLSQSLSYLVAKRPVRGLDFPVNETKTEAYSTFSQVDVTPSARHTDSFTIGYFPERNRFVGLDFFRPRPVTPDTSQSDYDVSARDNDQIGGGLLSSALSFRRFNTAVWAQGGAEYTLTPTVEQGNYFATLDRRSGRVEWTETYTLPAKPLLGGMHELRFGAEVDSTNSRLHQSLRPVNIVRADGTLAERLVFDSPTTTQARGWQYVGFVQDRWSAGTSLTVDAGLRYENQHLADGQILAPRVGFAWSPAGGGGTVVRGGIGLFHDKIPLNIRAFAGYPARTVTRYAADGATVIDQTRIANVRLPNEGLSAPGREVAAVPRSVTWNLQVDRVVGDILTLRANLIRSRTDNVYLVNPEVRTDGHSVIALQSSGTSRYRSLELSARLRLPRDHGSLQTSYIASRSTGDLNDFNLYFGDFGSAVIRPNQYSRLPLDVPRRFLAMGTIALPRRVSVSPIFEVRSGFPYSIVDATQQFVGLRNADSTRFPTFLALDVEVAKEFQVTDKYGVRVSVRGFNVTNHFNPRDVRANLGDPAFGRFFASYRTYFTGGFDIIF